MRFSTHTVMYDKRYRKQPNGVKKHGLNFLKTKTNKYMYKACYILQYAGKNEVCVLSAHTQQELEKALKLKEMRASEIGFGFKRL